MHAIQSSQTALPLRNDTLLGVCEAIGQDFGFHPNWLRIALGSLVMMSPLAAFGIYFGLGAIVGLSRLIAPQRAVPAAPDVISEARPASNESADDLRLAA